MTEAAPISPDPVPEALPAVVIGGGPAGLMAAEEIARAGHPVVLCEAKPSVGRKFLMAGKSGLNLTKAEDHGTLMPRYAEAAGPLDRAIAEFGPDAIVAWAEALGQRMFTGSTGRVFPEAMKASPLLRAWLARLDAAGVERRVRWRWTGWHGADLVFETPGGRRLIRPAATVLALGGASWARLGSDGAWRSVLVARGVEVHPFAGANAGIAVEWSAHMSAHFGQPLKGVAFHAGAQVSRGEAVLSRNGLEGGGIYSLSRALREGAALTVDLLPDLGTAEVVRRLSRPRGKASLSNHLRKVLGLRPAQVALLNECARPLPAAPGALAALVKAVQVPVAGMRPMDEAISTAGGVAFAALDDDLMLRHLPGTFCAGEMLDWEAPTGGYLLTACLATGRIAGRAAAAWITRPSVS